MYAWELQPYKGLSILCFTTAYLHSRSSVYNYFSPASISLCAWNSCPLADKVTSVNFWLLNSRPRLSERWHSGTLNCITFDCPEMLTLSPTTLTWKNSMFKSHSCQFQWRYYCTCKPQYLLKEDLSSIPHINKTTGKVKVKLSLCFNWAPWHEGIFGDWRYSSTHFWLQH
jgi:hypothetical protein